MVVSQPAVLHLEPSSASPGGRDRRELARPTPRLSDFAGPDICILNKLRMKSMLPGQDHCSGHVLGSIWVVCSREDPAPGEQARSLVSSPRDAGGGTDNLYDACGKALR